MQDEDYDVRRQVWKAIKRTKRTVTLATITRKAKTKTVKNNTKREVQNAPPPTVPPNPTGSPLCRMKT